MSKVAGLECETVDLGSNYSGHAVILHGYGANRFDLKPLAEHLGGARYWYFLEGPLEVNLGYGMFGRAWFPISMERLMDPTNAPLVPYQSVCPPGLVDSANTVMAAIAELELDPSQTILGGFSQGSMVALRAALLQPNISFKGILLWSSHLVDEAFLKENLKNSQSQNVLMSHGKDDPVLSFQGGKLLLEMMEAANKKVIWKPFAGGHEIPMEVISASREFIAKA